jgi:DNA-binding MarR family transcriptional regulator
VGRSRTDAGDAFSEFVVHVFRLDGLLSAAGDAVAAPAGQTTARWRVLAAIEPQPLTVAQIARAWGFARQSVQRVADTLERDGLVAFEKNPAHERAYLVAPTAKGRRTLTRIQAAQRAWADDLGGRIGAENLDRINVLLARVFDVLGDE